MEITIELPKVEEFKRVNELAKQVHQLHVKWRPDLFLDVEEVISKEQLEKMIQEKSIYVAKLKGQILGYITFDIKEKVNLGMRYRKVISVEAICVDENNRGEGIGTLLLNQVKSIGKENGCTDMALTVNEENESAIKVYKKFGLKVKNIAYSVQI